MTRIFITTTVFDRRWSELGLSDDDLRKLEKFLMENPGFGDVIKGTGGAVKLRWTLPNTGKSSGVRVIYIDLIATEQVHFLTCYPKSKKHNLSEREKSMVKEVVKRIVKNERVNS